MKIVGHAGGTPVKRNVSHATVVGSARCGNAHRQSFAHSWRAAMGLCDFAHCEVDRAALGNVRGR